MNFWIGFLIWVFVGFVSTVVSMVEARIDGDKTDFNWFTIIVYIVLWPITLVVYFSEHIKCFFTNVIGYPFRFLESFMENIATYFYNLITKRTEKK